MSSPNPGPADPVSLPARLPTLDGLRAIAILLVVPHNLNLMVTAGGLAHVFISALYRGWVGGQLLFFLRGVLINRILLHARHAPRLYPPFFSGPGLRGFTPD